ncbi:hypothetical protein [Lactococcus taiwanensis]|uniref:hypothetical protein n=1 Tax=Lactococcus taiwanensis TaxID=1151742 RepID=UPI00289C9B4E|nr:hypothetical protein [Lactococcus taiwanensis]
MGRLLNDIVFGTKVEDERKLLKTRSNGAFQSASNKIALLVKRQGVNFIDANKGLADEQGNLKKGITFDGLHMLPEGYEIVLKNLMTYLENE